MMTTAEIHSQALTRHSQLEALRSNKINDNFYFGSYHSHENTNRSNANDQTKPPHDNNNSITLPDNFLIAARRGSHTLPNEPIFIGRNELEQIRISRALNTPHEFESHSLPRRTCIHHKSEEYTTHSLPRRDQNHQHQQQPHQPHHHHYVHEHPTETKLSSSTSNQMITPDTLEQKHISAYQDTQPSYVNMNSVSAETYSLSRRSSMQHQQQVPSVSINLNQIHMQQLQQHHQHHQHFSQTIQQVPPSDEMCSTCSSETESGSESQEEEDDDEEDDEEENENENESEYEEEGDEEKEIFIDFKPHQSPTSAAVSKKKQKKLIKAMSQGEILVEHNEKSKQKPTSASEEDLKRSQAYTEKNLLYTDTPIRDEDIFKVGTMFTEANAQQQATRYSKETFRKRSISLEDPLNDAIPVEKPKKCSKNLKANCSSQSGSPGDGRSFASSDDITREHSEQGHWNESQITILPCPPRYAKITFF